MTITTPHTATPPTAAELMASGRAARLAEPVRLGASPDLFEHLASWALGNVAEDDRDLMCDVVAAMAPHLPAGVAAMYWEELQERIVDRGAAELGEHPGDVDGQSWVERCRECVGFTASMLAGDAL